MHSRKQAIPRGLFMVKSTANKPRGIEKAKPPRIVFIAICFLFLLSLVNEVFAKPARIVSMNLCSDELVLRLADRKRIAAVTKGALLPYISSVADLAEGIKTTAGTIEEVLILDPDIVITGRYDRQKINMLKKLGIKVHVINTAKNFSELKDQIRGVAEAINENDRGEILIKDMEDRLKRLYAQKSNPVKSVFYRPGGLTAGPNSIINSMMEAAGVENIALQSHARSNRYLELENLIMRDPELIIFSDYRVDTPTVRRDVLSHPAIKKGFPGLQTVYLPSGLLICPSPATIEAAEILSQYVQDNLTELSSPNILAGDTYSSTGFPLSRE